MNGSTPATEGQPSPADYGRTTALPALRDAAARVIGELDDLVGRFDEDLALDAVMMIDDALTDLIRLRDLLPGLVARADAGPDVGTYLLDAAAAVTALSARTAEISRDHQELSAKRAQFDARVAEHAELLEQLTELRRLERLADVLDDLALQRSVIENRIAAVRAPVGDAELALERGSTELLALSESSLAALGPRARNAITKAARTHARLADLEAEVRSQEAAVAESTTRYADLRAQYETRTAELQAHLLADRAVAAALGPVTGIAAGSGLDRARAELDALTARLSQVDAALGAALGDRDRASARRPIPWA